MEAHLKQKINLARTYLEKNIFHWDALFVIAYTVVVIFLRNYFFPLHSYSYYEGLDWRTGQPLGSGGVFDLISTFPILSIDLLNLFMKVIGNIKAHKPRSFGRNLIFNALRIQVWGLMIPLLKHGVAAFSFNSYFLVKRLVFEFALIAIVTILANQHINKATWFKRFKLPWSILCLEYTTSFGWGYVQFLNLYESIGSGSLLVYIVMLFVFIHLTLGGDYLEDFFCGDLGTNYGQKSIGFLGWDIFSSSLNYYLAPSLFIPLAYLYQYLIKGSLLREGYLQEDFNDLTMMAKMPIEWKSVDFACLRPSSECLKEKPEEFAYLNNLLLIATVIWGSIELWYQLGFLQSIRKEKKSLVASPEKAKKGKRKAE